MRLILLVFLLLAAPVAAWEDWNQTTKDSFARTTNWIMLDWHSTDMAASRGWDGVRETNPILGDYPSRERLGFYMLGRIGLNYWIHDQGYGNNVYYQIGTLGHALAAANNYYVLEQDDKVGHVIGGAIISETVAHYTGSRWKGCAAALGAGLLKEAIDSRTHKFDFEDAAATGLGCSILRIEF